MGFFDMFGSGVDINEGMQKFKDVKGAILLDVRTAEEYDSGHIPQSVNLPLDRLDAISCERDTPLFVYCHSGVRSRQAVNWLEQSGFTQVTDIGGICSWRGAME